MTTTFPSLFASLDATVASGWCPGLVAGIRIDGVSAVHASGTIAFGSDTPMQPGTRFRIASLGKPFGGALAAMLIADGTIALDEPVSKWLPEMASLRVLARPDADLTDTVALQRPVTVRDLLIGTNGIGVMFEETPLAAAYWSSGAAAGPVPPQMDADTFMQRICALPLRAQPGQRWMYHTGCDLLSVLMVRATGRPLRHLLRARICEPLGMTGTSFQADCSTLPTVYEPTDTSLAVDANVDPAFAQHPLFETFSCGLVSTAPDLLAFFGALLDPEFLRPDLREHMLTNQIDASISPGLEELAGSGIGWGWQIAVDVTPIKPWHQVGRVGWSGGTGTSGAAYPASGNVGVILTQRMMSGPDEDFGWFWNPFREAAEI